MQAPSKFSITPVAAAVTAAMYPGYAAIAQDNEVEEEFLDEIIVTSRKRAESVQEIPATIQAISQEALAAMGSRNMEDFSRFIPSVNIVSYGSGSSTVVFRGAITGSGYIAQATSSIYLDEISVTNTGSQPTLRAVDMARIEALSGPQGTLYGSDAQAGTMRMITNKPVMNHFEAVFDGEVRGGPESDSSYRGSLTFNIPLVEDKLALRVVGFSDQDGGFIDNVFGHTADISHQGYDLPSGFGTLDNAAVVEKNWNDADIYGGRVHLRWEMNDNWAATGSIHHQTTKAGADNYFDPYAGDLEVVRFHNEYRNEEFDMYSFVLEGDLGFAQLVSATSYFERDVTAVYDITSYAHYWAGVYCTDSYYTLADPPADAGPGAPYYWVNPATDYIVWWPVYCNGPTIESDFFSTYYAPSHDDKFTQEFRLSSQGDTVDWIVGLFYEESTDSWEAPFNTPTTGGNGDVNIYQNSASLNYWEFYWSNYYGTPTTYPGVTSSWHSESVTDWEQTAVFGEVTWHITDDVNLTLGGRYFERSNTNYYLVNHPGALGNPPLGEPDPADNESRLSRLDNGGYPRGRSAEEEDFIPKVSLSWAFSEDKMMYGLYTRGQRPGGVNRSRGDPFFPNSYTSDLMDNYEFGVKTNFADGRGRFNATVYHMAWTDYQLNIVDPASSPCLDANGVEIPGEVIANVCGQPWQQVIANAGEAHIDGINVELDYAAGDNWLLGMNFEVMEAESDTTMDLNDDGSNNLVKGLRLPIVPSSKGSAWAEFHTSTGLFGAEELFVRTQWSYTGDSVNILEPLPETDPNPQVVNPSYTIGDIRFGLRGDTWEASLFVNNVTDERAIYTTGTGVFEWGQGQSVDGRERQQTVFTNRPMEMGFRFMKRWGD